MEANRYKEGPISIRKNKRQNLGPKWSISEVGTPPPHNLDKPHVLLASINNNNFLHSKKSNDISVTYINS